jgi:hypothetical protein
MGTLVYNNGWCSKRTELDKPNLTCRGDIVGLPGPLGVHPMTPKNIARLLFSNVSKTGKEVRLFLKKALGVHLHNYMMKKRRILLNNEDMITELLKENCPLVSRIAGDEM